MAQEGLNPANQSNRITSQHFEHPVPEQTDLLKDLDLPGTTAEQRQELSLLKEIVQTFSSSPDLSEVSLPFFHAIRKMVDCQVVAITTIDQAGGVVTASLFASSLPIPREPGDSWPLPGSAIEYHLGIGKPHIYGGRDPSGSPGSLKYTEAGIQSNLWTPVTHQGKIIGCLIIRSQQANAFTSHDIARVNRVATAIAQGLASSILYSEALRQKQFAQALNRVSRVLHSTLDYDQVLELICQECSQLLRATYSALWQVEGENLVLKICAPRGKVIPEGEVWQRPLHDPPSGVVTRVAKSNKPEFLNHIPQASPELYDTRINQVTHSTSIMAVPLSDGGRLTGVLVAGQMGNERSFTNQSLEMAEAFASHAIIALQNSRLHNAVQRYTDEVALADGVARIITSTLNIDQVYEQFAQAMKKLVPFDRVAVAVIDQESDTFTFKYVSGITGEGKATGDVVPLEGTHTKHVCDTARTLVRSDITEEAGRFKLDHVLVQLGVRATITVPLISNGRAIGVLSLRSQHVGAYGPREQALLERLAKQIAPAIENAQLYQDLQASAEQMALVDEVARIITSTLDIDQAYEQFAREMRNLVDFDRMVIDLIDGDTGEYVLKYLYGPNLPYRHVGYRVPIEGTVLQEVLATGHMVVRNDVSQNPRYRVDQASLDEGLRSSVAVPLFSKGQIMGFIGLRSHRVGAYGPREQAVLDRLAKQIAPAIEKAQLYEKTETEKDRTGDTLAQLQAVLEAVASGIILVDENNRVLWANQNYYQFFGLTDTEIAQIGTTRITTDIDVLRELSDRCLADPAEAAALRKRVEQDNSYAGALGELKVIKPSPRVLRQFTAPVFDHAHNFLGRLWVYDDITQHKELESQLLQSQKMESLGRLAGGIAHDFNNLLAGIVGFASLLKTRLDPESDTYEFADIIENATQRGADLTQQLLTAARKSPFQAKPINVNDTVQEVVQILSHTLYNEVDIISDLEEDLPLIQGDTSQLHQVMMNLGINGADAMPSGGTLSISTRTVYLDEKFCNKHISLTPGPYVQLKVSDNGIGIKPENQSKIFEPFFTTKDSGKGTGLGLSVVYGVVKNHGGVIDLSSEVGRGTTFELHFPVYKAPSAAD